MSELPYNERLWFSALEAFERRYSNMVVPPFECSETSFKRAQECAAREDKRVETACAFELLELYREKIAEFTARRLSGAVPAEDKSRTTWPTHFARKK